MRLAGTDGIFRTDRLLAQRKQSYIYVVAR
jgi:hypothetical protein